MTAPCIEFDSIRGRLTAPPLKESECLPVVRSEHIHNTLLDFGNLRLLLAIAIAISLAALGVTVRWFHAVRLKREVTTGAMSRRGIRVGLGGALTWG